MTDRLLFPPSETRRAWLGHVVKAAAAVATAPLVGACTSPVAPPGLTPTRPRLRIVPGGRELSASVFGDARRWLKFRVDFNAENVAALRRWPPLNTGSTFDYYPTPDLREMVGYAAGGPTPITPAPPPDLGPTPTWDEFYYAMQYVRLGLANVINDRAGLGHTAVVGYSADRDLTFDPGGWLSFKPAGADAPRPAVLLDRLPPPFDVLNGWAQTQTDADDDVVTPGGGTTPPDPDCETWTGTPGTLVAVG